MQDNIESIDCPDCQLQLLQQQTQAATSATGIPENHAVQQGNHENLQGNRNSVDNLSNKLITPPFSHETITSHYNISTNPSRAINSSSSSGPGLNINTYSYGLDTGGGFQVPSITNAPNNPSLSLSINSSIGISISSSTTTSQVCDTNFTSGSIEPCDYNGYCSTCAILDLPTNEKYYRPGNSRPHVFPPMFYTQGPSSVIPCFSPIPECGPWGNEYNPYSYSTTYSQSGQTASVSSEYYGTSNIVCNSGATSTSFESCISTNVLSTSNVPTTPYADSSSYINTDNRIRSDCSLNPVICETKPTESQKQQEFSSENDTVVSIEISSSSCSSEDTDNESSCGSETGDSINSEDRELISVVEDDEGESSSNNITKVDINQLCESGRTSSAANSKCWICQNPISITDCSSPQLAKILEHIDEEITAEDLDISVSSGDIEIGGIEDEMKDFNHQQKKVFNSSIATQGMISFSRLAIILGIHYQNLPDSEERKNEHRETDIVTLCYRCAKLVGVADSLERQLCCTVATLNQHLIPNNSLSDIRMMCSQARGFKENDCSPSLYPTTCRFECKDESTQTEVLNEQDNSINATHDVQECCRANGEELLVDIADNQVENWNEIKENAKGRTIERPNRTQNMTPITAEEFIASTSENEDFSSTSASIEEDMTVPTLECEKAKNNRDFTVQMNSLEENLVQNEISKIHDTISVKSLPQIELFCQDESQYAESPFVTVEPFLCISKKSEDEEIIPTTIVLSEESQVNSGKAAIEKAPISSCNFCQRVFSTKSNFRAHQEICKFKMTHEQNPVFPSNKDEMRCSKCGIGFRSAYRKRKHLENGCNSVVFECESCSKRFSKLSELKAHTNLHLGEKPYRCEICNASFSTRGNQVAHSRTHSSSKKFTCSHCDKGFNRRYALMMHINRHNGVKPFSCTICNKSFSDPSNLNNHKKRSHRESFFEDE